MPAELTPAEERIRRRLRVLAVLEDEIALLFVKKVAEATKLLTWEQIAEATGVTKQAAWRRWRSLVEDPSSLRTRRDSDKLRAKMLDEHTEQLTEVDRQLVTATTEELASGVIVGHDNRPWSNALRRVLRRRGLDYMARQEGAIETHFFVTGTNLFLAAVEQADDQAGGVYATLTPSAEAGLQQGIPPKMERVSFRLPDQLWPPKERLEETVAELLDKLLPEKKGSAAAF